MRKPTSPLAVVLVLFGILATTPRSAYGIGMTMVPIGPAVWLAVIGVGSLGYGGPQAFLRKDMFVGYFFQVLGALTLNEERKTLVFQTIDTKFAGTLGLTEDELEAYNSEIDLINLVSEDMVVRTQGKPLSQQLAQEVFWESSKDVGLSQNAIVAVKKVVAGAVQLSGK